METKNLKKLIGPFIVIFLISFVIINWSDISWVFNYKFVSSYFSGLFQKDNQQVENGESDYVGIEDSLIISKIEVSAPLIFSESSDTEDLEKLLNEGVVHFPDSVLPGENGQTVILGHSAPPNWPEINYDWVFSNLGGLEKGDEITVYFNHQKYAYFVKETTVLERGEEIPQKALTYFENMLVLVSCWPPGKDLQRIAVWAELEK